MEEGKFMKREQVNYDNYEFVMKNPNMIVETKKIKQEIQKKY